MTANGHLPYLNAYTMTPLCGYGIMTANDHLPYLNEYTMTPLCGYGIMTVKSL